MPGVVACDDGIVLKLGGGYTVEACIAWGPRGPEEAAFLPVHIDGLDATGQVCMMARVLSARMGGSEAVLLDSLTTAGFNIVSPATVSRCAGAPVIVAYKRRPRLGRIRAALEKHFPDYLLRWRVLRLLREVERVETRLGPLYLVTWGVGKREAGALVERYQYRSRMPEPLRLAHLFASEISRLLIPGVPQP